MSSYSWIPAFEGVSKWLLNYENRQGELISLLSDVGIDNGLTDRDSAGEKVPLTEIDPFTFFSLFMKYGLEKRKKLFSALLDKIELDVERPTDFDGVPSAQALKVWLFPYIETRTPDFIPKLWTLFKLAHNEEINEDAFNDALSVPNTGFAKLTECLFYAFPYKYFPIDAQTKPWLKAHNLDIPSNWDTYNQCMSKVREKFNKPFPALSHEAWRENMQAGFSAKKAFDFLNNRYAGTYSGTSHIATFRTSIGEELAFDPGTNPDSKRKIQLFIRENPPNDLKFSKVDVYEAARSRNHHLKQHAKSLSQGNKAYKLTINSLDQLINLCDWYDNNIIRDQGKQEYLMTNTEAHTERDKIPCLNVIYYGPPGTGKTYKLQELLKDNYTDENDIPDKNIWLNKKLEDLSWFEIIVLVLLDSGGYKKVADIVSHEYYKIKAKLNERGANLRATAWSALQSHTVHGSATVNYKSRVEPLVFNKTDDTLWYIDENQLDQLEEYKNLLTQLKTGPEQVESIKRYAFVTFHQSYGYEEFIEGLRPITDSEGNITYEVKPGVFKRICKQAEVDPDNQYAIVIDEINRGNISKIFGELITLVETDKRAGAENALMLTLPYSGLPFSVPSNLDIIGTMNTADRSLTHIDVALRRRFEFIELRTDYSLIPDDIDGINLRRMLYAINQRIELLLDREHILGHALLMNVGSIEELEHTFTTNVMPLLEEHFFENWDKINRVLNNNGFIEEKNDASTTWLGESDDYTAKSFRINLNALDDVSAYRKIYSDVPENAFAECDSEPG